MRGVPSVALSVRQPWAWAIVTGRKPVENRMAIAITRGGMRPGFVYIHASKGMTRAEYEEAREFMATQNVACPRPDALVRGAIIGAVEVTEIVKDHPSPWFFGPRALVLRGAEACEPIPLKGALGYFDWRDERRQLGLVEPILPWMTAWPGAARADGATPMRGATSTPLPLFDEARP